MFNEEMNKKRYDIAQICLNGHIINDMHDTHPEYNQKFCEDCGEGTITTCQECNTSIDGTLLMPNGTCIYLETPPNYCAHCGKPYPWTKTALEAAKELAQEIDGLSPEEREILSKSIDEIVKGGPKTVVATTRFKKIATKFGAGIGTAFRDILVDVASESAKKMLWP